jgi:hypothetical protein
MKRNYAVAVQLVASRVVLSCTELVRCSDGTDTRNGPLLKIMRLEVHVCLLCDSLSLFSRGLGISTIPNIEELILYETESNTTQASASKSTFRNKEQGTRSSACSRFICWEKRCKIMAYIGFLPFFMCHRLTFLTFFLCIGK